MINPVVYNYNSTIYPYVKINYQRNSPVPVNRINAVTHVTDKTKAYSGIVKHSEGQTFTSNSYDKTGKSAEATLLKGSNINLLV